MHARSSVVAAAVFAAAATLVACAPDEPIDVTAAQAWLAEQDDGAHPGEIGSAGGLIGGEHAQLDHGSSGGITFDMPADEAVTVTGLLAGCYGDGTATVSWDFTGTTGAHAGTADVTCDGELHELDPPVTDAVVTASLDAVRHTGGVTTWFAVFVGD